MEQIVSGRELRIRSVEYSLPHAAPSSSDHPVPTP
jgi:hypothetical protein